MTRLIYCCKLQRDAEGLASPPFPGTLGQKLFDFVSKEAWAMWLGHQTMLINEYRLSLIDPNARNFLQQEMEKYFFGEGSDRPSGFVPKDQ